MNIQIIRQEAYQLLHQGTLALARAEQVGMGIDVEYCERKRKFLTRKIEHLESNVMESKFIQHWKHRFGAKFNLYSTWQLSKMLYEVKKISPTRLTPSGKGSTDDKALSDLNMPELNTLLEIRKLTKIRDTYLEAFVREQIDGIVHPFFNLGIVRTFRSSSDRPNFQNIPARDAEAMKICRQAIYPPTKGHQLVEVDYSGIEVRIAACYHKDPTMLNYINDPGSDMHGDMAQDLFLIPKIDKGIKSHKRLRTAAKNGFVFPQFYGDYYKNNAISLACDWGGLPSGKWTTGQGMELTDCDHLSDHLIRNGIKSFDHFVEHVKRIEDNFWNKRFPMYQRWKESWFAKYQKLGYLDMFTGFRCSGLMDKNDVINYPVQGAAFHCLLWSFIQIDKVSRMEGWKSRLIGQIHDAMLFDMHPDELNDVIDAVRLITCKALPKAWPWIIVPLEVDVEVSPVDHSWAEKKSLIIT
jgi:DNA polymerase I